MLRVFLCIVRICLRLLGSVFLVCNCLVLLFSLVMVIYFWLWCSVFSRCRMGVGSVVIEEVVGIGLFFLFFLFCV